MTFEKMEHFSFVVTTARRVTAVGFQVALVIESKLDAIRVNGIQGIHYGGMNSCDPLLCGTRSF
jgi:hypothetical protein